jgi:hypothetical protein
MPQTKRRSDYNSSRRDWPTIPHPGRAEGSTSSAVVIISRLAEGASLSPTQQ